MSPGIRIIAPRTNIRGTIMLFVVFLLVQHTVAASTPEVEALFRTAHAIFEERFADVAEGVHPYEGLLFVVTEFPLPKAGMPAAQGEALQYTHDALVSYSVRHFPTPEQRPEPGLIARLLPNAMRYAMQGNAHIATPRFNTDASKFPARVLVSAIVPDSRFRHVTVFMEDDVRAAAGPELFGVPTDEEVSAALGSAWRVSAKRRTREEMARNFDLIEDVLLVCRPRTEKWDEAPWLALPVDMTAPRLASLWRGTEELLQGTRSPQPGEVRASLNGAPPTEAVLLWFERFMAQRGRNGEAVLWRIWRRALAQSAGGEVLFADAFPEEPSTAFLSWARLADHPDVRELAPFSSGVPEAESFLARAWGTMGHADVPVRSAAASPAVSPSHEQALELFEKGEDLSLIIDLAAKAVEETPGDERTWRLLGHALLTKGRPVRAVPFLVQSLLIHPESAETRALLAMVYQECEAHDLAVGMGASVFFACEAVDAWSAAKARNVLEKEAQRRKQAESQSAGQSARQATGQPEEQPEDQPEDQPTHQPTDQQVDHSADQLTESIGRPQ